MNGRSARVSRYDYSTFGAILPSGLALSPPIEINGLSGRRVHYRFGNEIRKCRARKPDTAR